MTCRSCWSASGSSTPAERGCRFSPRRFTGSGCPRGTTTWAGSPSYGHDLDKVLTAGQISGVARVEPRRVGVGRGGDEELHDARPGCPAYGDNGRSELAVTGGDRFVDGKGGEPTLELQKSTEPLGPDRWIGRDQHAKVELGQGCGTDRQLALERENVDGDHHAGVEYVPHLPAAQRGFPRVGELLVDQVSVLSPARIGSPDKVIRHRCSRGPYVAPALHRHRPEDPRPRRRQVDATGMR